MKRPFDDPIAILSRKAVPFLSCLVLLTASMAGAGQTKSVVVLDQVVMGETRLAGEKIGEFSAIVRNPEGGVLAVSDRGYIAHFAIDTTGDRLASIALLSVHVLTGADGQPMRDGGFNPEAAALLADGTIAIVDETGPRLAIFDTSGKWLADARVPAPVRDASRQASEKDGIEALGWTADTGFIVMTEEPQLGQPRNLHTIHTDLAGSAQIVSTGGESVSIKGIETDGPELFVLERTRDNTTDALNPFLRVVDLPACLAGGDCNGQRFPITLDGITDADFEGLVALGDGRFLKVSDDKIDGDLRSVFVLLRVE
jgi:hypothetical protein